MSNNPLVSIIIPAYNSERYIEETIASVLNQTWKNIEVIIIDDGSEDNTLNVAKKFKSDRIKIFHQGNKGASSARNVGIKAAKGKYIQFLDADDLLGENKIEEQVRSLQCFPNSIGVSATIYFDHGTNPIQQTPIHEWYANGINNPIDFLIKLYGGDLIGPNYGGMITVHSWLIPYQVIEKAGFWDEALTVDDDGEYFCRVVLASEGIIYSPNGYNYYRKFKNSLSLSSRKSIKALESAILSADMKYNHLQPYIKKDLLNKIFCRMYWELAAVIYPKHLSLYKKIRKKIRGLGDYPSKSNYTYTKVYRFTTKYFGWKLSAWISFIKQNITKHI